MSHPSPLTLFLVLCLVCANWSLCAEPGQDPAANPPPVNLQPGPEYADQARMFQGIPSVEQAPHGRLWATWYGGGVTEDQHNYILLVTSDDEGRSWSDVKVVLDPDREGPVRAFDPCPWLDPQGRLWLFWAQRAHGLPYLFAMTAEDADREQPTWSQPRLVGEGIMMCKPTVTSQGVWLLPTAIWNRTGSCRVLASTDQGQYWSLWGTATVPEPADRNCDEPMIVQRRDGSLWLWVRTRYGIGHSRSTDEGRTWSDVTPSPLAHPAARFFVRRLQSGNLLLVKHGPLQQRTGRSHLTAYLSKDDGSTWQGGLLLDERPSVSYPDGCQQDDGRIVIIYDRERTDDKEILLATFTESDVLAGTNTSGQVRLRVLINRATGQNSRRTSQPKPNPPLRTHGDGAAPLFGLGAECRSLKSGEPVAKFVDGAKLFTDRDYHAENLPALLSGRTFVQASINGTKLEIVRPGVVFVVTPLPDRNRDSVAESLMKQGFAKVAIPEFRLFGTPANLCTMYQKQVAAGDVITLAKWGVLCY